MTGAGIPLARAISRFRGLPIGVNALLIVIEKAKAMSRGFDEIRIFLARESIIGVPMSARVSFISTAAVKPKPKNGR